MTTRTIRADAQRNREKLLAAATAAFADHGTDVSLEQIAKDAGVGIGTLYRHFPTRDALVEAAYRTEVERLTGAAEALLADHPPDVALAEWMERFVAYAVAKRGMKGALQSVVASRSDLFTNTKDDLLSAIGTLLDAGVAAGKIRADVDAEDVLRAMSAIWQINDEPGWQEQARTLLRLLMDGLPNRAVIVHGDNLPVLRDLEAGSVQMVYADPPFNTGRTQERRTLATVASETGDRTGFGGRRYASTLLQSSSYRDSFDDYLAFLEPRLRELQRVLSAEGTLYLHLDYREAHYVKLLLDEIFGRECFLNELIWAYDYGAKTRRRWPQKHDTILVYVRDPARYLFDSEAVDREPYMAPGLVTPEKRERGKRPTSVMWHTIVSPTGREKTGYPTQKPEALVRRFVQASSRPGDLCLDPFAGSGTLGAVARKLERRYLLIDANEEAVEVMRRRLGDG